MIHRIDVRAKDTNDPLGASIAQQIHDLGKKITSVQTSRIFLLDTDANPAGIAKIAQELLADPIVESAEIFKQQEPATKQSRIEVHLKPGVMDPVAASTEMAVRDLGLPVRQVRTGRAFLIAVPFSTAATSKRIAARVLANGVIESVHFDPYLPNNNSKPAANTQFQLRRIPLRNLTDEPSSPNSAATATSSSPSHEMNAIQNYFREQDREPTDIELETLAQTWSEHCVHKTLKSAVDVEIRDAPEPHHRLPPLQKSHQGNHLRQHHGPDRRPRHR